MAKSRGIRAKRNQINYMKTLAHMGWDSTKPHSITKGIYRIHQVNRKSFQGWMLSKNEEDLFPAKTTKEIIAYIRNNDI